LEASGREEYGNTVFGKMENFEAALGKTVIGVTEFFQELGNSESGKMVYFEVELGKMAGGTMVYGKLPTLIGTLEFVTQLPEEANVQMIPQHTKTAYVEISSMKTFTEVEALNATEEAKCNPSPTHLCHIKTAGFRIPTEILTNPHHA